MKRRDFVIGAAGLAGMFYRNPLWADPCPPTLTGSTTGGMSCPRQTGTSTLVGDAESLGLGEWTDSIAMPSDIATWDISWQNRTAFYDDSRGEIQYMGKPQASAGGRNRSTHHVYSEETNTWRTISTNVTPDSYGHIWCVTFDHTVSPGDYYHVQQQPNEGGNTRTILRYNRQADSWGKLPLASFDIWNNSSTPNPGMCYHPNLLGPGRPGIYCFGDSLAYFDVASQTWTQVRSGMQYTPYWGRQNTTLYVPGLDLIVYGTSKDNDFNGMVVRSGDADNQNPTVITFPAYVTNAESRANSYHMLLDPTDPTKSTIMLLQRDGGNVYTSNNPIAGSWALQPYQHPIYNNNPYTNGDRGATTVCSIPRYGVVLGMGSHSGGGTIMWRPGSRIIQ